jgi:hypothetical protein
MSLDTQGAPTAASPTADETENNAAAAAAGSPDANTAESSAADEDGAQPKDLLSVVKDAVQKGDGEAGSPTAEGKGEAEAEAETEAKPVEGSAEDQAEADKKLPFHEHPRWKEVIAERDGFREDAGRFREIEGFMQQHGLEGNEVAEGFDIMAKLKSGDPEKLSEVREYFASRLAFLDDALGFALPDDLRERVETGALDEEAAQELARARANEKIRTASAERTEKVQTEQTQREQAIAAAQACATAVDEWEKRQKASDPDYARKAELVETTCRAIVQQTGKPPKTPEEAIALAENALKRVNDQFKSLLPKPKAIRPSPTGSSAPTVHEHKTLKDAIRSAVSG